MSLKEDLDDVKEDLTDLKDEVKESDNDEHAVKEEIDELIENGKKKEMFEEENRGNPGHLRQILVVLAISLGSYIHGTSVVWPIVLSNLISDMHTASQNASSSNFILQPYQIDPMTDVPWIVSIFVLGNFIGSLINAPMTNGLGRKWTCILGVGVTYIISFVLVLTSVEVRMLYVSRVLMGIALGVSVSVSNIYIQDVATPDIRGSLGAIPSATGALGVFTFQVLNAFLGWWELNLFCTCLAVPYIILILSIPESPVYLVSRKRMTEARFALARIRGSDWDLASELEEIKAYLEKADSSRSSTRFSFRVFQSKSVYLPVLLSVSLVFLMNMSGINVVMNYTVKIFADADSSIDKFFATVYVGIALLISNIITVLIAHKLPRRRMLLISAFGVSLSLGIMGLYFQLKDWSEQCRLQNNATITEEAELIVTCDYGNIGWLPVATLMTFIFVFNLGYGAMVFITAIEILPAKVREVGMSLVLALNCPVSFLVSYTYEYLMSSIKGQGCFWLYAVVSFAGFIYLIIFLPETQGKSEKEIQSQISRGRRRQNSS